MEQSSERHDLAEQFNIREVGSAVREVTATMTEVVRSEVQLAKAEMKDAAGKLGRNGVQIGVFVGLAFAGILPFISFCVIGLGEILGGNYWLSSLIVSAVFIVFGGLLAYRAYSKIKDTDYMMPETTKTLNDEKDVVQRKVHQISEVSKRRSA